MNDDGRPMVTAFAGERMLIQSTLAEVARAVWGLVDQEPQVPVLIFEDESGKQMDLDLRGTVEEVLARLQGAGAEGGSQEKRGPGRPRLGVVAREVTLLPRHWDWLGRQPGGASVTLRRLVEAASRKGSLRDRIRTARDRAYRFMSAMGGNLPGFEEAIRALYAGRPEDFDQLLAPWPPDIRAYAQKLAIGAFAQEGGDEGREDVWRGTW